MSWTDQLDRRDDDTRNLLKRAHEEAQPRRFDSESVWRDQCLHRQYRAWDDIDTPRSSQPSRSAWRLTDFLIAGLFVGAVFGFFILPHIL